MTAVRATVVEDYFAVVLTVSSILSVLSRKCGKVLLNNTVILTNNLKTNFRWGVNCGLDKVPGIYVNVGHFVPWVDRVLQSGR